MEANTALVKKLLKEVVLFCDKTPNSLGSHTVVFHAKKAHAYNDVMACSFDSPLELTGAFEAFTLLKAVEGIKSETFAYMETEKAVELKTKGRVSVLQKQLSPLLDRLMSVYAPPETYTPCQEGLGTLLERALIKDNPVHEGLMVVEGALIASNALAVFHSPLDTDYGRFRLRDKYVKVLAKFNLQGVGVAGSFVHFQVPNGYVMCRRADDTDYKVEGIMQIVDAYGSQGTVLAQGVVSNDLVDALKASLTVLDDPTDKVYWMVGPVSKIKSKGVSGSFEQTLEDIYTINTPIGLAFNPKLVLPYLEPGEAWQVVEVQGRIALVLGSSYKFYINVFKEGYYV